jgi:hypothetical protein
MPFKNISDILATVYRLPFVSGRRKAAVERENWRLSHYMMAGLTSVWKHSQNLQRPKYLFLSLPLERLANYKWQHKSNQGCGGAVVVHPVATRKRYVDE